MVFNFVFGFDDIQERLWYLDSGLEEVKRTIQRFKSTYSGDPAWTSWLARMAQADNPFVTSRDQVCGGRKRPKGHFPHPGGIMSGRVTFKNPKLLDFLKYLNDWFYRDLSSSSHGHWHGLANRAAQILRIQANDDTQTKFAQKYKSDCIFQQMTLVLCLVSEVIAAAGFDNKSQAGYLWGLLAAYWGEAKELHAMRYGPVLS
jgi:hypothetical protein